MRIQLLAITAAIALLVGTVPAYSHGGCCRGGWGGPSVGLGFGFGGFPYYGGFGGFPYYNPYPPVWAGSSVTVYPSTDVFYRPSYGNRSAALLARVQARLKNFGYYRGPIDGHFGPGTQRAIVNFQRDSGLVPSGRIDGRTLRLLR